jgi:hypothetical protein
MRTGNIHSQPTRGMIKCRGYQRYRAMCDIDCIRVYRLEPDEPLRHSSIRWQTSWHRTDKEIGALAKISLRRALLRLGQLRLM